MPKDEMFDLSGKVAMVTAGGHGLGREICDVLAEYGADVICSDINEDLAQETAELVKRHGHRALAIQADVSRPEDIELMVERILSEFSTIDVLFCNAGIMNPLKRFHELSIEDWDKVVGINLRGTFLCMRAVLPIMLQHKKGSVIITSSIAGIVSGRAPLSHCYGATKAGVIGLTKHVAVEYAKEGIRINAIAPGLHDTKPLALTMSTEDWEEAKQLLSQFIPMGRCGEPTEIKGLALYLASDASSYVTGQVFVQDGGMIA